VKLELWGQTSTGVWSLQIFTYRLADACEETSFLMPYKLDLAVGIPNVEACNNAIELNV
jgi:hypothetical protein